MKKNDMFPSKYLKASDCEDGDLIVTIREVKQEDVGSAAKKEVKAVVYFEEVDKGLVLNKTNWNTIEKLTGNEDTDEWAGEKIALYATEVEFQGDMVMSVRVRLKKPAAAKKAGNGTGSADTLAALKGEAWKAIVAKHPDKTKDEQVAQLAAYVDQCFPGQTTATIGSKQWRELIDSGFDSNRLAMAGGGDDTPF